MSLGHCLASGIVLSWAYHVLVKVLLRVCSFYCDVNYSQKSSKPCSFSLNIKTLKLYRKVDLHRKFVMISSEPSGYLKGIGYVIYSSNRNNPHCCGYIQNRDFSSQSLEHTLGLSQAPLSSGAFSRGCQNSKNPFYRASPRLASLLHISTTENCKQYWISPQGQFLELCMHVCMHVDYYTTLYLAYAYAYFLWRTID